MPQPIVDQLGDAGNADGSCGKLTRDMTTRPQMFIGKRFAPLEWFMSGIMKMIVQKDLESTRIFIEQQPKETSVQ